MLLSNPRQTIIVSCRGAATIFGREHNLDELFPTEWHTPISKEKMLYAVVLPKSHHATEIIRSSNVFAVNFPSFDHKDAVIRIRKHLGETLDKFMLAGFTKVECEKIDCPRIAEAVGFLECGVKQIIDVDDNVLFVGEVVDSGVKHDVKRLFFIEGEEYTTTIK
ncbi:flavin reductase family protein [Candidatus Woesearchaeota archaeon]|nr:flavin reductase family protein [Candidatus Woesearchaeota archaeon]